MFRMPSLGADMEAGTLVEWLVQPGDTVKRGDIIAVVETQKGAIEIEIFTTGKVERLVASIGDELSVGEPMAEIQLDQAAEASSKKTQPIQTPSPSKSSSHSDHPSGDKPALPVQAHEVIRASPAARRLAQIKGIDLSSIRNRSGPSGAIRLIDVECSIGSSQSEESPKSGSQREATKPMRDAIAAAMARSKREIPHYYLSHDIDLQKAHEWLKETNIDRAPDDRLLMGVLLLRASALAAQSSAHMNGFWVDGDFQHSARVHPGLVVSLRGGGLVAPALHDANRLDLESLRKKTKDLVTRARTGRLRSSEISAPTITVSSLGERGVDSLFGVIFPPQVAIVGFGAPRLMPAIVNDEIAARFLVTATLAADHRVSDGRSGARFLSQIAKLLQAPEAL
jgi:pyruvate dehydrogenase E2 component (dihydrolipoamide acetyltransferase)